MLKYIQYKEISKIRSGDVRHMKKIQSTCNLCALACNLDFHVEGGEIKKVTPTKD